MNRAERDRMEAAHVRALQGIDRSLADGVARKERGEREQLHREVDAGLPPLREFGGLRTFLTCVPGFAGLWQVEVPAGHLHDAQDRAGRVWQVVTCTRTCSAQTILTPLGVTECAGACGRWFLAMPRSVRVKRFDVEAVAA